MLRKDENRMETIIGKDARIEGDIKDEGGILVRGHIHGNISSKGLVIVHKGASVKGNVFCKELITDGSIEGNVHAERIEIQKNGYIKGEVEYKVIVIEEGGKINGNVKLKDASSDSKHAK